MRKLGAPVALLALALTTASVLPATASPSQPRDASASAVKHDPDARRAEPPRLRVKTIASGLDVPWDVRSIGDGQLLFTQRDSATLTLIDQDAVLHDVQFPSNKVWVSGETGLLGLAIDPDFATNHRIYTCQGWKLPEGKKDIRVIAWQLNESLTAATQPDLLIKGIQTVTGRHGGCRLLIDQAGSLHVGTGDAAVTKNPQSLRSLNGKTLRLDPETGQPWPTNPWVHADNRKKRFIFTYGHRNVQGLAQRADGSLWSVEHGTYRDDEINLLGRGRNFGWQPGPNYDESPPMTDFSLPGKQWAARWSSGNPTIATSGADFVAGNGWGAYSGTMAVGCLGGERLMFVKFDDTGHLVRTWAPQRMKDFGRIRGVTAYRGGLLVTTSNGGGGDSGVDKILFVRPRA
ncbi:PQQ-dependent sugar dehydrogenase [Nocardioides humilatus]|uniref:PQQ-dependent sugar dehydrogenase n=1 Tax=Nocardioides humilatus TaxID=2607660 RepID=A0A5B1L8G6_9ACTN|nr:PQQ-dependent sugar dehydrogenase [Nocardioides humilatus]KAA1416865.1 PQQ-dependent sugar dehydrogenase [Nocardioides humilatus]